MNTTSLSPELLPNQHDLSCWKNFEGRGSIITKIKTDSVTGKEISRTVKQLPSVGERRADGWFIYYETGCHHSPFEIGSVAHRKCIQKGLLTPPPPSNQFTELKQPTNQFSELKQSTNASTEHKPVFKKRRINREPIFAESDEPNFSAKDF